MSSALWPRSPATKWWRSQTEALGALARSLRLIYTYVHERGSPRAPRRGIAFDLPRLAHSHLTSSREAQNDHLESKSLREDRRLEVHASGAVQFSNPFPSGLPSPLTISLTSAL